MKTRQIVVCGLLAVVLALSFVGCGDPGGDPTPTVTSVIVSAEGDVTSVDLGETLQFNVQVIGANSPPGGVTWSITTPGIEANTEIDQNGLLTVASDETVLSLTVRATSTFNTSIYGNATVTVRDPDKDDLEEDVTITVSGSPVTTATTGTLLTASYSGSEIVTYLWYRDGEAISYANSGTCTAYNAGKYTVMVSAANYNSKISDPVTVTVSAAPPEQRPAAARWSYWTWESTATVDHFEVGTFDNEPDVCKVTIGGIPQPNNATDDWGAWRATVEYSYTAKSNTFYVYEIKAWTDPGDERGLNIQWYNDGALEDYRGDYVWLTTTPTTHTFIGEITKGGVLPLAFQCADQLGTFYVKVVSITEYTPALQFELIADDWPNPNNDTYRLVSGLGMTGAVTIPATYGNNVPVTEIGWDAFRDSGITSVIIPANVNFIRGSAFDNSNKLASVTFAQGSQLAIIEGFAFGWCSSLTSITIPSSVEWIGAAAFAGCSKLTNINVAAVNFYYSSTGGILYNSDKSELVAYPAASGNVTISPQSVTTIGEGAFAACYNLTGVTIPSNVTSISEGAFAWCESITSITIPATVMSIDGWAFSEWTSSQTIIIQGYSNQAATDAAWGSNWRSSCDANIIYSGVGVGSITAQFWIEGNTVALTAPTLNFPGTPTAQGWETSDDNDNWSNFTTPTTADTSDNGKYLRYYATSGGQTYYSNTVTIRVFASDFHPSQVTIAIADEYGDGWNGAALRITVNGSDLPTSASLADGKGPEYYRFNVTTGDVVKLYWITGNYDDECMFAVYFGDSSIDDIDFSFDDIFIFYESVSAGNGALMGQFTVP